MLLYIIFICTYVLGLVYIRGDTGGAIDLVSKVIRVLCQSAD